MNAAKLDRYLAAESAYNAAKADGLSGDEARDAAREAVAAKQVEQFARKLGLGGSA